MAETPDIKPGDRVTWTHAMEIVVDGRIFQRTWRTIFADRCLVTLAKRFAHDAVCSEIPFGC